MERDEVEDVRTFALYCNQTLGTDWLTVKEAKALNVMLKRFFDQRPTATYATLVRTVDYVRAKRIRLSQAKAVIRFVGPAYTEGMLPELAPTSHPVDDLLEARMAAALAVETDPGWLRMLEGAQGVANRREVYKGWRIRQAAQRVTVGA